jgi:hypothetical protein
VEAAVAYVDGARPRQHHLSDWSRAGLFLVSERRGGPWDWSKGLREQELFDEHADFIDRLVDDGFVLAPLASVTPEYRAEMEAGVTPGSVRDPHLATSRDPPNGAVRSVKLRPVLARSSRSS